MHDSRFIGCIRVSPPLNEHEMAFLRDLSEAGRTLRSTPTGRGNSDVPFARLAWEMTAADWQPSSSTSMRWTLPASKLETTFCSWALSEKKVWAIYAAFDTC